MEKRNNYGSNPLEEIQKWIKVSIQEVFSNSDVVNIVNNLIFNKPPSYIKADYTFSIFNLSGILNGSSSLIATRIVDYCARRYIPLVTKIYAIGPYINLVVDRELYYRRVLNHIENRGCFFGVTHKKKPCLIHINNLDTNFRASLVERAISKEYKWGGNTVLSNKFNMEDVTKFIQSGQKVIRDALKYKIARYINTTNVIITLPSSDISSVVLQKQDKSFTKSTLYLAHQRETNDKKQSPILIYISSVEELKIIQSLIAVTKKLRYISMEANISIVSVNQTNAQKYIINDVRSWEYALLRVASHRKALLTHENFLIYPYFDSIICCLGANNSKKTNLNTVFDLVKLLIIFPDVINNSANSQRPENLCDYLETIADLCKRHSAVMDKYLSQAVILVLQNGLTLLTS